jgi:hypothetical protein
MFISNLRSAAPARFFWPDEGTLFATARDVAVSAGTATAAPNPVKTASRRVMFGIMLSYKMYNISMI